MFSDAPAMEIEFCVEVGSETELYEGAPAAVTSRCVGPPLREPAVGGSNWLIGTTEIWRTPGLTSSWNRVVSPDRGTVVTRRPSTEIS